MPPRIACMLRACIYYAARTLDPLLYVACVLECGQTASKTKRIILTGACLRYSAGPQGRGSKLAAAYGKHMLYVSWLEGSYLITGLTCIPPISLTTLLYLVYFRTLVLALRDAASPH